MSKRIISPDILEQRMLYMDSKSIWFFIEIINQGLQTNQVEPDGIIKVTIKYNVDSDILNQIVDLYLGVGWKEVNISITGMDNNLYGTTELEFIPPHNIHKKIKRMIQKNM
jgi:hypothetical protein